MSMGLSRPDSRSSSIASSTSSACAPIAANAASSARHQSWLPALRACSDSTTTRWIVDWNVDTVATVVLSSKTYGVVKYHLVDTLLKTHGEEVKASHPYTVGKGLVRLLRDEGIRVVRPFLFLSLHQYRYPETYQMDPHRHSSSGPS